jgi:hypothetical protein
MCFNKFNINNSTFKIAKHFSDPFATSSSQFNTEPVEVSQLLVRNYQLFKSKLPLQNITHEYHKKRSSNIGEKRIKIEAFDKDFEQDPTNET